MKLTMQRIHRAAARVPMTGVALDRYEAALHFEARVGNLVIGRDAALVGSSIESPALAAWFEDRVGNVLAGRETIEQAFADAIRERTTEAPASPALKLKPSTDTIEQSIDVFRAALKRLGIPERNVKVTWDTAEGWARFRAKLDSGGFVDKVLNNQVPLVAPGASTTEFVAGAGRNAAAAAANGAALATWLKGRARGFALGAESRVLDEVFAGYLQPAVTP
ncbi:MAG: hypothetical protein EPO40_19760 [Myxococcaceae bacterium]|nr:MAG: hypothetical protein EPO40_19760 [Myxococcaceae bacterium]